MPLILKDFNFLCSADLSIPIKSAVLEILPWFFFNCVIKYSFSKCSLASFNGAVKDFSKIFLQSLDIKKSSICLEAKQKKQEFGGASLKIKKYQCEEEKIIKDKDSKINFIWNEF